MHKNRTVTFIILMFLVVWATLAVAQNVSIKYENNLLSASIQSATLKEIFEELKKQTGLVYEMDKEIEGQKVTVEFKDMSLKAGIEKILDLTGLKDLAISYKEVTSPKSQVTSEDKKTQDTAAYEISKVEIRKRTRAEMEKIEAEEEEIRREKYQKKEKWYHSLFKDMGKEGKLEGMLKDYAEGKNRIDVETYLRQATFKSEEKPLLREAYRNPKFADLKGAIAMGLIHAIGDKPEEGDKEFLLELFKTKEMGGMLMYSMKFIWDERFVPVLIDIVKDTTEYSGERSTAAEILGLHKVKEAVPALEEALVGMWGKENITHIHGALTDITGMTYKVVDGKAKAFPYETPKADPEMKERRERWKKMIQDKKDGAGK